MIERDPVENKHIVHSRGIEIHISVGVENSKLQQYSDSVNGPEQGTKMDSKNVAVLLKCSTVCCLEFVALVKCHFFFICL